MLLQLRLTSSLRLHEDGPQLAQALTVSRAQQRGEQRTAAVRAELEARRAVCGTSDLPLARDCVEVNLYLLLGLDSSLPRFLRLGCCGLQLGHLLPSYAAYRHRDSVRTAAASG
jgi:hypothetical protein